MHEGQWSVFPGTESRLLDTQGEGDESSFDVFLSNVGPGKVHLMYWTAFNEEDHDIILPGSSKFISNATGLVVQAEAPPQHGAKGTWRIERVSPAEKPEAPSQQGQKSK